ncbi:carboxymuconolactone decarboxylase family protein [Methylobacillus arboreus]|uniref:carboxymuconolactone decarboxylase family protein n=1 Tax=Methylobacillus arboreus TaxID=755170 RepID=UPI001E598010|nr:carboxymuconolactone decarboxylase family protein [Methylobacillus arboreus]MCB5191348.1 carboxymuconolactone decarboxylase family protein [Methylobacillus arboreus]
MTKRFDYNSVGYKAMLGVNQYIQDCGLDHGLLELIRLRVSQINGCAFCINMHVPLAKQGGISDDKIHLVAVWKEAGSVFSEQERAAIAWAEAVTWLRDADVPDAAYQSVKQHFTDQELSDLTFAVVEINAWNRLMVASRTPPAIKQDAS